jgi:hypothetical protein
VAWLDDTKFYFGKYSLASGLPQNPASRFGSKPSVVTTEDGSFGLAYVDEEDYIILSELDAEGSRCADAQGPCELRVGRASESVLDLAYHEGTFLVATDSLVYAVWPDPQASVPNIQIMPVQTVAKPELIEAATQSGTTAILSTNVDREFAMTFLGCF